MLKEDQISEIEEAVNASLDQAEHHWKGGAYRLSEESLREAAVFDNAEIQPSKIPGYEFVIDGSTVIDTYIAYVADMRESSKHLMCAISEKRAKVSELQRIYYETSALLPALALTVKFAGGNVTEFLGDGVLAFFKVDKEQQDKAIYAAYEAAKNSIGDSRRIINSILNQRYLLPDLDKGVGLGLSQALVTLVGIRGEKQAKAFGKCVFYATKLSGGRNQIFVDEALYSAWPSTNNGKLIFNKRKIGSSDIDGYLVGHQ